MKKLGTPIGAAPGREKENVGFDAVGTPLDVVGAGLLAGLGLGLPLLEGLELLGDEPVVVGP